MLSPLPAPGWVYVMSCPDFPHCVKIGGTSRTAMHRAGELVGEYGTAGRFAVLDRHPVSDWFAVEQAAHRMLSDRRLPRSELFRVAPAEASRVIRAAARAYDRPSLFRRLLLPRLVLAPQRGRYGLPWRRRGTNWIPVLLVLSIAGAAVTIAKPSPPAWLPASIARTLLTLERL